MNKFYIIISLWALLLSDLQAQETGYIPSTGVKGAFLGSVLYPGFKVGIERPYKVIQRDKERSGGISTVYKERYLSGSLGMYHHKTFHSNYFLQIELVSRRQKSKGFFVEGCYGAGLSRTFFDGATYRVENNGEVKKVQMAGKFYGILSLGGSLGYNFSLKSQKPVSVFLKTTAIFMFPYDHFIYPRPFIELGLIWRLKNFWVSDPVRIHKIKNRTN